jgi:hypothetical protein
MTITWSDRSRSGGWPTDFFRPRLQFPRQRTGLATHTPSIEIIHVGHESSWRTILSDMDGLTSNMVFGLLVAVDAQLESFEDIQGDAGGVRLFAGQQFS